MLIRNGLRLFGAGFVVVFIAGFFHPAPGWMLDLGNVLGGIGVINLLTGLDMHLTRRREENRELEAEQAARRARCVAAIEREHGSMNLMMLELHVAPPTVYMHFHQDPPQVRDGVVLQSPAIRAYRSDECPECALDDAMSELRAQTDELNRAVRRLAGCPRCGSYPCANRCF